jgi:hypothetical protein
MKFVSVFIYVSQLPGTHTTPDVEDQNFMSGFTLLPKLVSGAVNPTGLLNNIGVNEY